MTDRRTPCAILGAGGYIGQHFARLLAEHPYFEPPLLVGGERSAGRRLSELWQLAEEPPGPLAEARLVARSPSVLAASGVEVAFSALPSGTAGRVERQLVRRGVAVFTNAADHRLDPDVPLVVPEVNPEHLGLLERRAPGTAPLVANANCTTTGLVLALAPVARLLRPRSVHVASYQALSGAGFPGVPSLHVADNVVPHIPEEEEKVARETARILGRFERAAVRPFSPPVLAQCARVAVREGHLEAVTVEARGRPGLDALLGAWREFDPLARLELPSAPHPPVELRAEADRPQPVRDRWAGRPERARGMAAVVGRVRWEPPFLRFFTLSHNAVRGGAGGSVLNAELARARGLLPGPGGPP